MLAHLCKINSKSFIFAILFMFTPKPCRYSTYIKQSHFSQEMKCFCELEACQLIYPGLYLGNFQMSQSVGVW